MRSSTSILIGTLVLVSSSYAAVDTTSNYLPNIVNGITDACATPCTPFENAIRTCVKQYTAPLDLATCSCSKDFLTSLATCAMCIDTSTPGGAQQVNYDGFFNQCIAAGITTGSPVAFPGGSNNAAASGAASPAATTPAKTVAPIIPASTVAPVVPSSTKVPVVIASASAAAAIASASKPVTNSGNIVTGGLVAGLGLIVALVL